MREWKPPMDGNADGFVPDVVAWDAWRPEEAAPMLTAVRAPWYVAAGWAIDLFLGGQRRNHDDLEIAVPQARFGEVATALAGYDLFVVGNGRAWPLAEAGERFDAAHQTWVRDRANGCWRLDIFREPSDGATWICRRDARIRLPYPRLIRSTADGIPYACPEVVLLFKAKAARAKDDDDLAAVLPRLGVARRRWLADALMTVHPGHRWLDELARPPARHTRKLPDGPGNDAAAAGLGRTHRSGSTIRHPTGAATEPPMPDSPPTVVLLGTLDTKGHEFAFVRDRLLALGVRPLLIDAGILGPPLAAPDVPRDEVAGAAGTRIADLVAANDRGASLAAMANGAAELIARLHAMGRVQALFGMGGSGGSTLLAAAAQRLPVGVPKLLVSTLAAGDTRPFVGATDLTLMYPVVDIAGLNRLSTRILGNAAAAIAGMARADDVATAASDDAGKPLVGATMFGVTTIGVTAARERLEELGYEVLVFHATGTGGDAMENLVAAGYLAGVLDLTTTELADELVGGVMPAGPLRLRAGADRGVPRVVSLGALDMVNFGPMSTVPAAFRRRTLHRHNDAVTLMRTTPQETAELGRRLAERLNALGEAAELFVPLRGISQIAVAGGAFHDAAADEALFAALRAALDPVVPAHWIDADVNDPVFARSMADALHAKVRGRAARPPGSESAGRLPEDAGGRESTGEDR